MYCNILFVVVLSSEYRVFSAGWNHLRYSYLEKSKIEQSKINRDTLRDFYSVLKNAEEHLRFFFITGVSKFSKTSMYPELNHTCDLTTHPKYALIVDYTQEELEIYLYDNFPYF